MVARTRLYVTLIRTLPILLNLDAAKNSKHTGKNKFLCVAILGIILNVWHVTTGEAMGVNIKLPLSTSGRRTGEVDV